MKPTLANPTYVKTSVAAVKCVGEWGHGRAADANFYRMPGILTADDGDGHFFAYRCIPGKTIRETAEAIAPLFLRDSGDKVCVFEGRHLAAEPTPPDFWLEDGEYFRPNIGAYPNVIAY